MDFIRVPFGYVLEFFYGFLNNYGLALILFSFVVKLILLPFSAKSKKSMMKMSRLQPQLKQLELACGDDKQKYQQEVMALYKSEGVSMYGGCLWSFLPLLFLLPLYTVIREPLHYLMHLNTETVDALKAIVATEQGVEVSKLGYYWQYGPAADLQKYALQLTDASMREAVMGVSSINFSFLGINLGQIPSWKVWQAKGWSDIGGFIVPLLSGGLNYLSMFISQKMNGSGYLQRQRQKGRSRRQVCPDRQDDEYPHAAHVHLVRLYRPARPVDLLADAVAVWHRAGYVPHEALPQDL